MDRKLVTLRRVRELKPIPDADRIELALVDGWQCVVGKGDFQSDDVGVFFEIDSLLPVESRFEFLRKSYFKKLPDREGFRLRTVKLRGQLSQGLLMPLKIFPEIEGKGVGDDVTEVLGVIKYEPLIPAHLAGTVKGSFPSFVAKSDEERLQNLPGLFETCRGLEFEATVKMDGSSMTAYWMTESRLAGSWLRS
jgi:RNA ligase (TIGR02306 family)